MVREMEIPRVFIAHGHDNHTVAYIKEYLTLLGLKPIVVSDIPHLGRTLDEKVHSALPLCSHGIIVLSKDDQVVADGGDYWQPRLNVLQEMGWLEGRAKNRLIVVKEKECKLPTNIQDIGYLSYVRGDYSNLSLELLKELRGFDLYRNYHEVIDIVREIRGHENIYDEFTKLLDEIDTDDEVPKTIRTINSFPAEAVIRRSWDKKVIDFLRRRKDCSFTRVVFYQKDRHWASQLRFIYENYVPLENYHHYEYESSPRIMELFLVEEENKAILSFSTHQTEKFAPITVGIKVRSESLCQQLRAYHRRHLQDPKFKIDPHNVNDALERLREMEHSLEG